MKRGIFHFVGLFIAIRDKGLSRYPVMRAGFFTASLNQKLSIHPPRSDGNTPISTTATAMTTSASSTAGCT